MKRFKALAHRPFLLLWSGQTLSRLGDSQRQFALAWWVLERTGSAAAMGTLLIAATVPTFVFALLGGVAGDRLSRASLLIWADAARAALSAALAALAAMQQLTLWHLYVASALFGLLNAFFLPAYSALIPEVTPAPLLPSANALGSLSADVCGVVGPALGALLLASGDVTFLFALDAGSFLAAAVCLVALRRQGLPPDTQRSSQRNNLPSDLRAGLQAIAGSRWLWMTIGLLSLLNLTGRSPMQAVLPLLAHEQLRAGAGALGLLYTTFSLGSIAGALWAGVGVRSRRGPLIYCALALVGLLTLALGLSRGLVISVAAIFMLGMALAVANLVWTVLVQERVPAHLLGRVSSVMLLGSNALLPIGFGVAGWAADYFGPAVVFLAGGALTAALALLGLASRAIRELE